MVENFERYFKKKDGSNTAYFAYQEAKRKLMSCEEELENMHEQLKSLENNTDLLQIKLQALHKDYSKSGGVSLAEWKEISANLTKEEAKREEINRWLKEIANHYLPFIIVKKQMQDLLARLEREQDVKSHKAISVALQEEDIQKSLSNFLNDKGIAASTSEEIVQFLRTLFIGSEEQNVLFDLSNSQINRLIAQIYEKIDFEQQLIIKSNKTLATSLKITKRLREQLSASSIDGYEEYSEQKEKIEKRFVGLEVAHRKVDSRYYCKRCRENTT